MKSTLLLATACSAALVPSACDLKKTQEGKVTLPKVAKDK